MKCLASPPARLRSFSSIIHEDQSHVLRNRQKSLGGSNSERISSRRMEGRGELRAPDLTEPGGGWRWCRSKLEAEDQLAAAAALPDLLVESALYFAPDISILAVSLDIIKLVDKDDFIPPLRTSRGPARYNVNISTIFIRKRKATGPTGI
ncbi:unnamed protein product [Nesidiocoris tenuis]|uniref:Uncharacterized protein n=1 Tax=Nesidiocoris tenuis TaxID=355587 RepID=A0A6H5GLW9_9HEMI|nr:unnamed protein product [Nesidiocoris tenuis]